MSNFIKFFANPATKIVLSNTAKYVFIVVTFQFIIGFSLAYLLTSLRIPGTLVGVVGGLLFLPWVFPDVAAVGSWKWLFNDTYGLVNYILKALGLQPVRWFADIKLALYTLIGLNIWKGFPFSMILELAGLQTIPPELYEAASIDGASESQKLFYITLPVMRYIILTNLVLITIYTFNMFSLVYASTGGGPVHATEIIGVTMYKEAFVHSRLGYASAIAVIMLLFNSLGALIYLYLINKQRVR